MHCIFLIILKNPTDSIKPTYIFTEEIFSLYKKVKNEIEVGVCVLNVNARDLNILFKDIIDPLLELKKYKYRFRYW